jgi:diguanylate cyclase (GGDEF)-like protein
MSTAVTGIARPVTRTHPDTDRWIAIERLRLVYANLPATLAVSIASACLLALLLRDVVPWPALIAWFCVGALITWNRYRHFRQFRQLSDEALDTAIWTSRLSVGAALSGVFWGSAGVLLFPAGDLPHQVIIMFVLAGLSAAAMTSYASIRHCYFLFVLPMLLPVAVRMALEGTEIHYTMSLLILLGLGVVVRSASVTDRMINNVLKVRAENAELTRALQHQATHDALVDLVNHREFNARLQQVAQASARLREPYALLFIDLDRFKEINDNGGHAAGDETLRRVGHILKTNIRAHDTAARLGGDEFAILLPRCPRQPAEQIASRVLAAIQNFALDWRGGKRFAVGASIGVAYTDAGEHDASTMLRAADAACYAAKNEGRGRIHVHHADPLYEASGRFEISKLKQHFK